MLARYDGDGDGEVSTREVALVFHAIGCSPTEAELQVQTAEQARYRIQCTHCRI